VVKGLRGHFCPRSENNFNFDFGTLFIDAAQNVWRFFEGNFFMEMVDVHHGAELKFDGLDEAAHQVILHRVYAG
jgi:hypothetical protein